MKNLINSLFFAAFVVLMSACQNTIKNSESKNELSIIPQPAKAIVNTGNFKITKNTVIYCNNKELLPVAEYMVAKISGAMGFSLQIKEGTGKGINFEISDPSVSKLGNEGYELNVTPKNVVLTANKANGIFYGIQSLLQLLPPQIKSSSLQNNLNWEIPCVEIEDSPRFPWRGLMLDVSRHFFTKEEVKAYIDQLAEYKMNVFHWHLSDDQGWRIEIKSLPKLTEIGAWRAERVGDWWQREPRQENEPVTYGGFYTHEDIKEVVQYAKDRFVEVVPEIDVPGHSLATIVAYPEISCTHSVKEVNVGNKFYTVDENSLCPGKEITFEYLDKIFTEIAMLFPSEYIHVGGDECYKGFWSKCPDCQKRIQNEKLKDTYELQSYFIKRMEKMLEAKNKKLVGWDEILEGGLAPNATVMSWRGMENGIKAAKEGHQVIMTPTNHCYLDLYQGEPSVEPATYSMCRLSDSYNFEPVPDEVDPNLILGGQGNLWSEAVPTFRHAEYMSWPRGWALAEVFWSSKENKSWENFVTRVEDHFERADFGKINYARSMYNAIVTPFTGEDGTLKIKLDTEIKDLKIFYTFDNTNPDSYSPQYESPLSVPKNAARLRIITYKNEKPVGKIISLEIDELQRRVK
ncbi:MAG TPA: family 20 glycosylhydrolase [Draconibacterium sp.]|nr:family 20 glycosylhydrolase [Draconibacterium sp.]